MKSLVEEASTVAKALEKAWTRAGKPQEFSVKVFEVEETNFLGFTKKSAKVGIFFEEPQAPRSHYNQSDNRSRQGGQQRDQNRRPNPNARTSAPREPRAHSNETREIREVRQERPERQERPTVVAEQVQTQAAPRPARQERTERPERQSQPRNNNTRRPLNNNRPVRDNTRDTNRDDVRVQEAPVQQPTHSQEAMAAPQQHAAPVHHNAPQRQHHEVRQDVRPEGHVEHHDPREDIVHSSKAPAHVIEHESAKHSTQPAPLVRKVLKVSTRCYTHPKKNDGSKA
ncbi:hypothetical protein EBU24_01775 [bacterium]|nr:hypothetical protein [bacterium]